MARAHWEKLLEDAAQARREGRLDDAYRDYVQAAATGRATQDRRLLILALQGVGRIECDRRRLEAALGAYQEAAALARPHGDPFLLAHAIRHAGDVLRELGRVAEADAHCNEALAIYRSTPGAPPLDLANAIRSLALVEERLGATGEASRLWDEARQIYASLGVQAGVAESEARLAAIARRRSP